MCNVDCSECTIIEKSPGLMMTGIFRGDIGGIEPSVIELYALEDIADLSDSVLRSPEMEKLPKVKSTL